MARMTFKAARETLRAQGVTLARTAIPGEFRVALAGRPGRTDGSYYTDDLRDALDTGRAMARERDHGLHARAGGAAHFDTSMRLAQATNRL